MCTEINRNLGAPACKRLLVMPFMGLEEITIAFRGRQGET